MPAPVIQEPITYEVRPENGYVSAGPFRFVLPNGMDFVRYDKLDPIGAVVYAFQKEGEVVGSVSCPFTDPKNFDGMGKLKTVLYVQREFMKGDVRYSVRYELFENGSMYIAPYSSEKRGPSMNDGGCHVTKRSNMDEEMMMQIFQTLQ